MRKMMLFPILVVAAFVFFTGCASKEIRTTEVRQPVVEKETVVERVQPPAPVARVEVVAPPPSSGYVWVPGYWDWNGREYVWISGRYEIARPESVWVAGRWQRTDTGWQWIPGYWKCSTC